MDGEVISYLIAIIGGLVAIIIAVVGWIGNRVINRLDEYEDTNKLAHTAIYKDMNHLASRVTVIETKLDNK